MKNVFLALTLLFSGFVANTAHAWQCEAQSPVAMGYGVSYFLQQACDIALYECRLRTPPYMVCVVMGWY